MSKCVEVPVGLFLFSKNHPTAPHHVLQILEQAGITRSSTSRRVRCGEEVKSVGQFCGIVVEHSVLTEEQSALGDKEAAQLVHGRQRERSAVGGGDGACSGIEPDVIDNNDKRNHAGVLSQTGDSKAQRTSPVGA